MLYLGFVVAWLSYILNFPKALVILLISVSLSGTILQLSLGEKLQLEIGFPPYFLESLKRWIGLGGQIGDESPLLDIVHFFQDKEKTEEGDTHVIMDLLVPLHNR
jgi:hypothetical protein